MWIKISLLGVVAALLTAAMALAEDTPKFEVQPFIGGTVGGGIPIRTSAGTSTVELGTLDVKSGLNAGVTFGANLGERGGAEFLWRRQYSETELPSTYVPKGVDPTVNLDIDQYQGNFLYHFADADQKIRPFVLFGMGATTYRGSTGDYSQSNTRFSMGFGGGVKYYFGKHVGFRGQVRWTPTYLYSTAGGMWCGWYGYCYVISNDTWQNQVDFTGGVILRF
jgi:hypothetical protein